MSFWDIVWFIFITFAFMAYLMVLFSIITDLFRDHDMSGWVKAVWIVLLIILPLIASLVYVIARGKGMTERSMKSAMAAQADTEAQIRAIAGSASPAHDIAKAKELLDAGAISQQEYASLKTRALGS